MLEVLTLVRQAPPPSTYFPKPIQDLIGFVLKHPELLPALFDYIRDTKVDDPEPRRRDVLVQSLRKYPRARRLPRRTLADLERLLDSVYALKLPQNEDPRGRVVEYAVYCSKRIGNRSEPGYIKDYQCAVRRNAENGRTTPLVESDATFDVAWMSDIAFAGYECKCKVRPFVFWAGRVASGARRKLDFMQRTVRELSRRGRDSRSYLVGLERNVDPVRQLLKQESFDEVEIVDGDQLERLLA